MGVSIVPAATPFTAKSVPEADTFDIVTFVLPPFVRVTSCVLTCPMTAFAKDTLLGLTVSIDVLAVPDAPTGIESGEFGALLTRETEPETLPVEAGANATLKDALPPALIVTGNDQPDVLTPVPDELACVMVTAALVAFVRLMLCVSRDPTATFPKLTVDGVAFSADWIPEPLNATTSGEFEASLTRDIAPVAVPAACGANCT